VIKFLRRLLLALIVAIAVLSVGWFIYGRFFAPHPAPYIDTTTRAGIANSIRQNTQPVSQTVRMQVLDSILKNAKTPVVDKNGQVQNTTPLSDREAALRFINSH